MASPVQSVSENGSMHHGYSRKQKSLGLLCSNFLRLYNRDDVDSIGLDDAACKLGVERRRIYDIVNVLESVGVLARKAKNQYSWKGFKAIPKALALLKEEGLKENFGSAEGRSRVKVLDFDDDVASNPDTGSQSEVPNPNGAPKSDNRREKSLGLLTQNFVKLFLCSDAELISLDEAAKCLLGDGLNAVVMRTKVRRLYDIANVLSSMQLIEKTNQTESRKPAFRWLGLRDRTENTISGLPFSTEPRKREFGTDLTNISFKRTKTEYSNPIGESAKQINLQVKTENVENEFYTTSSEEPKSSSRSYRYGPFAPVTVAKVGTAEPKASKRVHDLESLATNYRPQYHNQALRDLFDHYVEAWSSWYSEVAGRSSVEQVS
ncbi:hypothetical protein RND81_10G223500 [Saponaria officinalis]|uniref:E2F/DP family winged-helix DNA-binding domain-containing protein n=1 Tax=Saponaria officinalis TaxID=3572 RepID=A0AAW1I5B1_SAPOF